jgi:cyclopropane-fatty-acyl-phospholipid synthase
VSNSAPQREFILGRAKERGLENIEVRTADMNVFAPGATFDRVVSVEMFEHMRNHPALLERVASWLNPDGRLFIHVFSHKEYCYPFVDEGDDDWMARHFFSGGLMPSHGLLPSLARPHLEPAGDWFLPGTHYGRTSEDWLRNMDARRAEVLDVLTGAYGGDASVWLARWRLFFMACAELFNYRGGSEWGVSHYVFAKAAR